MQLKILILFLSITAVFLLLIRVAIRNRNKGESVLREHSSAFKKPDIERVSKADSKSEEQGASFSEGVKNPDQE